MTVIIGLRGFPGGILCADSQETVDRYTKKSVYKFERWDHEPFRFSIGAAGAGHYCDLLIAELSKALTRIDVFDEEYISEAMGEVLLGFYQRHIWARPLNDGADVETLLLVQPRDAGYVQLVHTCETSVQFLHDSHKSIGIGSHLADYLLKRLFAPSGGPQHMLATALYVLSEVIENIDGCGKEPRLLFFRADGSEWHIGDEDIPSVLAGPGKFFTDLKHLFNGVTDVGNEARPTLGFERLINDLKEARRLCCSWAEPFEIRQEKYKKWMGTVRSKTGSEKDN